MLLISPKHINLSVFIVLLLTYLLPFSVNAFNNEAVSIDAKSTSEKAFEQCFFNAVKVAEKSNTLAQIEKRCEDKVATDILAKNNGKAIELGALSNRIIREKRTAFDPYIITPHKMNYILPTSITNAINKEAYQGVSNWAENLEDIEAKFQISIKSPFND